MKQTKHQRNRKKALLELRKDSKLVKSLIAEAQEVTVQEALRQALSGEAGYTLLFNFAEQAPTTRAEQKEQA